jgi:hypothetical protein
VPLSSSLSFGLERDYWLVVRRVLRPRAPTKIPKSGRFPCPDALFKTDNTKLTFSVDEANDALRVLTSSLGDPLVTPSKVLELLAGGAGPCLQPAVPTKATPRRTSRPHSCPDFFGLSAPFGEATATPTPPGPILP